jgi:hypothetical protein
MSGQTIRVVRSCSHHLSAVPLCGAFSCLRILPAGYRDMGFNRYREALIVLNGQKTHAAVRW